MAKMNSGNNITVKSNLQTIIKSYYIQMKEVESRTVGTGIKISELRNLQYKIEGVIEVISFTGQYIEELSLLLSMKREIYSILQKLIQ